MPKYRVCASYVVYLEASIEASDDDEAWHLAREIDGGDFSEIPNTDNWNLDSITRIDDPASS